MATGKNKQIDLGISKMLPKDFPDFNQDALASSSAEEEFVIEATEEKTTKPAFTINSNQYEDLYQESNWEELARVTQEVLEKQENQLPEKLYWIDANIKLNKVPTDILAVSLEEIYKNSRQHLGDNNAQVFSRTIMSCVEELGPQSDKSLELFEKAREVDPGIEKEFKNFAKKQKQYSKEYSKTAVSKDKVFDKLKQLDEILDDDYEEIEDIEYEEEEIRKSSKWKLILLLLVFCPLLVYYSWSFFASKEDTISLFDEIQSFEEDTFDVEIKIPDPAALSLSGGPDLEDILNNLEPSETQKPTTGLIDTKLATVNVSSPVEPQELADLLDGSSAGDSALNSNVKSPRSPFIVPGQSSRNPIVAGQDIAGRKPASAKLFPGDKLSIIKDTSLYFAPHELEAEIEELRAGTKVIFLKKYRNWFKVQSPEGRMGYIKGIYAERK